MKQTVRWSGLILAAGLLLSSPALAAKGLYLGSGVGLAVPSMSGEEIGVLKPRMGYYFEMLNLGYGFTDQLYAGLYYGAVAGPTANYYDTNMDWGTGYLGLTGKYSFPEKRNLSPYLELGVHNAVFDTVGDYHTLISNAAVGYMVGGGMDWFVGRSKRIQLSTDLCYRTARYSEADLKIEGYLPGEGYVYLHGTADFHVTGDVLLLMFKVGYVWRPRPAPGY